MDFPRHGVALLVACAAVLGGCGGDERRLDPDIRAAGLRFAPAVSDRDRAWILAAIEKARPEARALIDEVDGMVEMSLFNEPGSPVFGLTQGTRPDAYSVSFNVAHLNTDRKLDRDTTVLHELGHVVDHALMPPELRDRLAAALPSSGACLMPETGDCATPPERFADTFAKWSLRGAVSAVGVGYSVVAPASLEDWGAPLALLAIEIDVASR